MKSNLKESNTIQALWIGLGSLASFGFTLISSAVLSRYLDKADYGTYKQVMYLYNTLLFVFTLGLPKAYSYFLAKNEIEYGKSIVDKINRAFIVMGLFFSLVLFFGAPVFAQILNNKDLIVPLRLFSLTPAALLPTMGLDSIMAVYKKTLYSALYVISTRILMLVFVILPIILYKSDVNIAILGFTVSSIISLFIAVYVRRMPYKNILSKRTEISYKEIFTFSLPLMVASFGAIAIKAADQFFVSRYFGNEVFADFANGSLELPIVGMVLGAGATVLLPVFSKFMNSHDVELQEIIYLWQRSLIKSAKILYPMVIYCIFFAPLIMVFLYGEQYETSAVYFRIMLIVNLFTVAQYYPVIIALGATQYYAKIHLWLAAIIWTVEFLVVQFIPSPVYITIASVLFHILKIYIMSNFIAKSLSTTVINLFPIKVLTKILLSALIPAALSLSMIRFYISYDSLIIDIVISLSIFCVLILPIGKLLKVNYIEVVDPIIKSITKK